MTEPSRGCTRGKSFTSEQDEAICNAYLCITQDPIIATNQPRSKFWDRVVRKYEEFTNEDQRTDASIKARWQLIQSACGKYSGILRQIQRAHQSGMTEQNEIDLAKRHYKDGETKPFPNLDCCWAILEHSIKWADLTPRLSNPRYSQMDTSSVPLSLDLNSQIPNTFESVDTDSTPMSGGSVQSPRKRPLGTKKAKEKQARSKVAEAEDREFLNLMRKLSDNTAEKDARRFQMEERRVAIMERNMALEEKKVTIEEKNATIAEKKMEEQIMQMDLDLVQDPQMKAYYRMRKSEILTKWGSTSSSTDYYPDLLPY